MTKIDVINWHLLENKSASNGIKQSVVIITFDRRIVIIQDCNPPHLLLILVLCGYNVVGIRENIFFWCSSLLYIHSFSSQDLDGTASTVLPPFPRTSLSLSLQLSISICSSIFSHMCRTSLHAFAVVLLWCPIYLGRVPCQPDQVSHCICLFTVKTPISACQC